MRGVSYDEFGSADVLRYGELDDPIPHVDQVLVRVKAVAVNPFDALVRTGALQRALTIRLPIIPGLDVAGEVVAAGPVLEGFAAGDEVIALNMKDYIQHGTCAELTTVPERALTHKPAGLSFVEAAALPSAGLAAWQSLQHVLGVRQGDVVLIQAAAGGVGHLAVQMARELGAAKVIGTSSESNFEFVRSLGAEPIAYGEGLEERVAAVVGGDGKVDAVLDPFGGEGLEGSFACVRDPGRLVCLADFRVVARGGRLWGARASGEDLAAIAELAASGRIRIEVQATLPLERAADAHRLIEGRRVRGKLVLTV